MTATVNGERRELRAGTTLDQLLHELRVEPKGIAVAVNEEVVRGESFAGRELREGDVVEIIRAVAGG